jgi:hypothetical protein
VIEEVVLRKHTMCGVIVVLISWVVKRCQFIIRYTPFSGYWLSIKIIWSKTKNDWNFCNLELEVMSLKSEVEGGIQSITTPPNSGIELSHQLCVPFLMKTENVKYPMPLRLGDNLLKHGISLPLHVGPVHIELLSYWVPPVLDYYEVPICMEIIPKPVIMKV